MKDCLSSLVRLALDDGFPPLLSSFTVFVTPSSVVVCQEVDLLVVVKAPRGKYSSKSSQLYPLPPLPPWPASGSTATVLLLLRLWLATCKPYRGIFKRVCGRPSNCDSVWLLPIGSGTVTAPGKPKLMGKGLVSVYGFLVCFSFCSLLSSLCLSLYLSSWVTEKRS